MSAMHQYTGRQALSHGAWSVVGWVSHRIGSSAGIAMFVLIVFLGFTKPVYRYRPYVPHRGMP